MLAPGAGKSVPMPYGMAAEREGRTPPPGPPPGLSVKSRPKHWRPWNSPNHGGIGDGEGQSVLFADGSVNWHDTPLAGIGNDNIYTQWSGPDAGERGMIFGLGPSRLLPNLTPQADTDTLVYP